MGKILVMCLPEGMEAWAILRGKLNCKKSMSFGKRSIHFGGHAAFHDECGLQRARFLWLQMTKCRLFGQGRHPRRDIL